MDNTDYIFGLRPIIEAIRAGKQIDRLLVKQGLQGPLYRELMTEVRANNIPYQIVPQERIERITKKNHQGVLAWLSLVEYQAVENILPMVYESGREPLFAVLDNISDVRNFGAIVRSAECLCVDAIIIPEKGSARITADAIKTSAGALMTMPICRVKSLTKTVDFLKESGLKIVAATEHAANELSRADLGGPIALIMGSEDMGISNELLNMSDITVKIPLSGEIGSLNVSVAAGICFYEIARQRNK